MSILENLNWRYATKFYDNSKKVSQEDLYTILEAIRLAPTSNGLQPFKVFVINNEEIREKLSPIAYGQQAITNASYVLVFAGWDRYTDERLENVFAQLYKERNLPAGALDNYLASLKGMFLPQTAEENFAQISRQSYIALGAALLQAAELKVDSTPMEGFSNADLDALLGLDKQGLKSVCMMTIGYRDAENDWMTKQKKVRREKAELVEAID